MKFNTTMAAKSIDYFDPFTWEDDTAGKEKTEKAFEDAHLSWPDNTGMMGSSSDATSQNPTSFDSQFFATQADDFLGKPLQAQEGLLFPSDPMADAQGEQSGRIALVGEEPAVRIAIREQFSCIYDDNGSTSSAVLEGTIYIRPSGDQTIQTNHPFNMMLEDKQRHLAGIHLKQDTAENISDLMSNGSESGHTLMRVTLPPNSLNELAVASYTCSPHLRPIPMLVKSRVQTLNGLIRVGFKIRANPSNKEPINNNAILVAVPPFVQGETVKMSRKGGVWDAMKRIICWKVDKLEPGEALEIQAQFQSASSMPSPPPSDLQFPVLIRCDIPYLFSGITLSADCIDDAESAPVTIEVSHSTRILHRKV